MKTGTITFHAPNNNGSFLQAYALQNTLINQCHVQNEIIDFYSERQERQYSVFRKPHSVGDVGRNLISLAHYTCLNRRHQRFEQMRREHLILSKRCTTEKEVYDLIKPYDVIICGSDQIWNTEARDYSDVYFMTGDKRRISYAASFGSHIENVDLEKVKKNIQGFSNISVRETAGKLLLNRILPDENVKTVCDPTLLLNIKEYESLIRTEEGVKEPYIFLYTINYSKEVLAVAQRLSQELGIPVYAAFTGYSCVKCNKFGIKVLYDVGPAQFLWLVKHAAYICSNSFHGIAFSIIFGKQFCRPTKIDKNGYSCVDDRIEGLLGQIELNDRTVSVKDDCVRTIQRPIDYNMVNEKLDEIREKGIGYLKKALLE
ncbi:MAG: polysaccharide pyruvyl transferase family protein [Lachnospiraceae bacterium]